MPNDLFVDPLNHSYMTRSLLSLVALLKKVLTEVHLLVCFIIVILGEEGGEALLE